MSGDFSDVVVALARIEEKLDRVIAAKPAAAPTKRGKPGDPPTTLPNYGRAKGAPIAGAPVGDLEYYANGCRRTLADEAKARWHDNERLMLAAIEAELAKQGAGPPSPSGADAGDEECPF